MCVLSPYIYCIYNICICACVHICIYEYTILYTHVHISYTRYIQIWHILYSETHISQSDIHRFHCYIYIAPTSLYVCMCVCINSIEIAGSYGSSIHSFTLFILFCLIILFCTALALIYCPSIIYKCFILVSSLLSLWIITF